MRSDTTNKALKGMNNFAGLFAIACSFISPDVTRLFKASSSSREAAVVSFISPERNFAQYRACIASGWYIFVALTGVAKAAGAPFLPHLAISLTDMMHLLDSLSSFGTLFHKENFTDQLQRKRKTILSSNALASGR